MQHTPPFPLAAVLKLLGVTTALACATQVRAEQTVNLSSIEVDGSAVQSPADTARDALRSVPGGTNVVDLNRVDQGRVATNEDVFRYQAGIYAKAANNEGAKISSVVPG